MSSINISFCLFGIGLMALANRIVMAPMPSSFAPAGIPDPAHAANTGGAPRASADPNSS